jgi:hypothetical protein
MLVYVVAKLAYLFCGIAPGFLLSERYSSAWDSGLMLGFYLI